MAETGFDVVVRVARLTLECSAEGVEILEQYVARTAAAYGLTVDLVVLPEQIVVADRASRDQARVAVVRSAPGIFRLDQVAELTRVLARIEGGLEPADACRAIDEIQARPPLWAWWVRILGVALFAAGFAPSIVASWGEVGSAAGLGLLMGCLVVGSGGRPYEGIIPFVGSFLVTVIALTWLTGLSETTGVTLLVIPALFIVVPGDTLSAAAGELIGGHLTAGAVRLVYAAFVLGLIVVGIIAGAEVTGSPTALTENLPEPTLPYAVVLLGWVVFSVGLVLSFNAEPMAVAWLVPTVLATFLLQQGVTRLADAVIGTVVAGAALGAFAERVSRSPGRPPRLILVLGGFFVLTVGGVGVRGVTALIGGDVVSGVRDLLDFGLQMPLVALSLAIGVLLSDVRLPRKQAAAARVTSSK